MKTQADAKTEKRLLSLEERLQRFIDHVNKKFKKMETETKKSDKPLFVCRYCGKKTTSPSPGTCPYSPNGHHSFIKA